MKKLLAILGFIGLLSQTNLGQAAGIGYSGMPAGTTVCPVQTGAAAAIPANPVSAVPLRSYDRNNGVRTGDIEQIVPMPIAPGQYIGPSVVKGVRLDKYMSGNYDPEDINNYIVVAPAQPVTTGAAVPVCPVTPCPTTEQPVIQPTPAPEVPTGPAAPVRAYW